MLIVGWWRHPLDAARSAARPFASRARRAHQARYALAWSGGVTALETFWGDVPILTLPGAFMRGRHTAAMLNCMDLPELIAADVEDFVGKAATLATDASARARLRELIRERKQRLYRDDRVVDAFADLIEREVRERIT